MPVVLVAAVMIALTQGGVGANVVFVSPFGTDSPTSGTESHPFQTLPYAVSHAEANGTVYVLPGVYTVMPTITLPGLALKAYTPHSSSSSSSSSDSSSDSSGLEQTPSAHVLSGLKQYPSPPLTVSAPRVLIEGFMLTQFRTYASTYGAVYVSRNGEATVVGCQFSDNSVALSVLAGSVSVKNSVIDLETTGSTGTLKGKGKGKGEGEGEGEQSATGATGVGKGVSFMYQGGGNVAMEDCLVHGAGKGTAIDVRDGPANGVFSRVAFDGIRGVSSMGYISRDVDLKFTSVNATGVTQAFYAYGMQTPGKGRITIIDSEVANSGDDDTSQVDGVGVYAADGVTVSIQNSVFHDLHTTGSGSALYCGSHASMTVLSSSFTDTSAGTAAPAYCTSSCGFSASGNVLKNNQAKSRDGTCPGL